MGLLDTLEANTDEGRQLRGGLLNMGIGLLSGSTGNYGQFAPALAQGFAGYQQGRQQVIDNQLKNMQEQQAQALRNYQLKAYQQNERSENEANQIISSGISMNDAIRHPNSKVREWGASMLDNDYRNRALSAKGTGAISGLVPTTQGYAYRDASGNTQFLTGGDGKPLMPVSAAASNPTVQGAVAQSRSYGSEKGKTQAENEASFAGSLSNVDLMIKTIDTALGHPGLSNSVGLWSKVPDIPGSDASNFKALHNQIAGQIFLDAFERLKGAGAITDTEGQQAKNAAARLDLAQSEEAYREALQELRDLTKKGRQRLIARAGGQGQPEEQYGQSAQPQRKVVKTGSLNGRKVVQYDDGTMAYTE